MFKQDNTSGDIIAQAMSMSLDSPDRNEKDQKIDEAREYIRIAAEMFGDIHNSTKLEKAENIRIVLSELSQKTESLVKKQG